MRVPWKDSNIISLKISPDFSLDAFLKLTDVEQNVFQMEHILHYPIMPLS